jgi:glycosyltransferase involved in cell wall biosynthesis
MKKKKVLFLGETYRADAKTWLNGLRDFGDFEIITWELKTSNNGTNNRIKRLVEYVFSIYKLKKIVKFQKPDLVLAERVTSYGFLAAISGVPKIVVAQQGQSDLWPENSLMYPIKKILQDYTFKKATLLHAWGAIMETHMKKSGIDMNKVFVLPKGIDTEKFFSAEKKYSTKIKCIVTRSLEPEYKHDVILKAFSILQTKQQDFELVIVGSGSQLLNLKKIAKDLDIEEKVIFTGRISNADLPSYLQNAEIYISMPTTEGVSASLFEAMATKCYPIVSDIEGNKSWINNRENGQLVPVDNHETLADEMLWAIQNRAQVKEAVQKNRIFVEKYANYTVNMKKIVEKYATLFDIKNT